MISLLQLIKFSSKHSESHSVLIDFQQIYVRNILLFCTGLGMARILFGQNIICQVTEKSVSQSFVDTKCFINGTMTRDEPVIYHDYYQWVSVYLLLLAFGFYFPYSVWTKLFGNYLRYLESLADKPEDVIRVIKDSKGNLIFFKTLALEIFYIFYVMLILYITNIFFNNIWGHFGWSIKSIYTIFPDNGSCFVTYYHSSGSTAGKFNCLLPLSSVYRKIFMLLYGIVLILILLNFLTMLYRVRMIIVRNKYINVWWAFMIAKQSTVSWNARKKLDLAYYKMLSNSKENLIQLNDMLLKDEELKIV